MTSGKKSSSIIRYFTYISVLLSYQNRNAKNSSRAHRHRNVLKNLKNGAICFKYRESSEYMISQYTVLDDAWFGLEFTPKILELIGTNDIIVLGNLELCRFRPNSPGTLQDLNGTLTDNTSIKQAQIKTFLCFI